MSSSASPSQSPLEDLLRPLAHHWWLWALFGALSIVAGIIALADLGLSLLSLAVLFGCYLVVSGVFDVLWGLTEDHADTPGRIFAVVLGVLALIAGVICLRHPGTSLLVLVLVVGVYLTVAGALHVASAFSHDPPWVGLLLGMAEIALGVLILAIPGLSLVTFALLFGIALVVRGAVAIVEAMQLRRLGSPRRRGALASP